MSCGCGKDFDTGNCVIDVLKEIEKVQSEVVDDDCCNTSCEQSINDVLGETDRRPRNRKDTVPVILYNKDGSPFKGFGAQRKPNGETDDIVASFIFRVKRIDKDGCAVLELLIKHNEDTATLKDPTQQTPRNLVATGICITVNLHCFCHVTCLPAIRLRRG